MRIVHLSDLHFGRHDPRVVDGLADDIAQQAPALVVVSGDFTQRGARSEFIEAKRFVQTLSVPVFAVPGNHDLPVRNILERLLAPYARYRRFIDRELEPFLELDGVALAGLKTARRARFELNWASGSISPRQLDRLAETFERASPKAVRIVVAHHPLLEPENNAVAGIEAVHRSSAALAAFHALGVRAVLSGHFHLSYVRKHERAEIRAGVPPGPRTGAVSPILVIQASSTTSTRLRGHPNAYNLIDIDRERIEVAVRERVGQAWVTREEVSARS